MSSSGKPPGFGISIALLGFALYASHDAIIKYLGGQYSVFQIIFFTMLFAFVPVSLMIMTDKAADHFRPKHPWLVMARSVLTLIAIGSGFYGFSTLPLAEAYALVFSMPLLITVFSIPLLGETVGIQRWIAVFVGLIGVLIVLRPGQSEISPGHIAMLVAACANALSMITVRKLGTAERSAVLILHPMLLSLVVMGAMLPAVYQPVNLPDLGLMAAVGFLSVLAQLCLILAYRTAPAAVLAPMQYSQILWATLFGFYIFKETPDIYVGIGSIIIIASGAFIVWRETRANVSPQNPVLKNTAPRPGIGTFFKK